MNAVFLLLYAHGVISTVFLRETRPMLCIGKTPVQKIVLCPCKIPLSPDTQWGGIFPWKFPLGTWKSGSRWRGREPTRCGASRSAKPTSANDAGHGKAGGTMKPRSGCPQMLGTWVWMAAWQHLSGGSNGSKDLGDFLAQNALKSKARWPFRKAAQRAPFRKGHLRENIPRARRYEISEDAGATPSRFSASAMAFRSAMSGTVAHSICE